MRESKNLLKNRKRSLDSVFDQFLMNFVYVRSKIIRRIMLKFFYEWMNYKIFGFYDNVVV